MNTKVWISVSGLILLLALLIGAPGSSTAAYGRSTVPAAVPTLIVGKPPVDLSHAGGTLPIALGTATRATSHTPVSEGFESTITATGWETQDRSATPYTQDHIWAASACHPHSGSKAIWSNGGGTQAGSPQCGATYPNNLYTVIAKRNIDLSKAVTVTLEFYFWGKSEEGTSGCMNSDFLWFGVSPDDSEQNFAYGMVCGDMTAGPEANGYHKFSGDVSFMIAGRPSAVVAFALNTNASGASSGFMIDDVTLRIASTDPQIYLPLLRK